MAAPHTHTVVSREMLRDRSRVPKDALAISRAWSWPPEMSLCWAREADTQHPCIPSVLATRSHALLLLASPAFLPTNHLIVRTLQSVSILTNIFQSVLTDVTSSLPALLRTMMFASMLCLRAWTIVQVE